ncbi:MAG: polyprenyl synthetase family protein [Syntrophomonadaceae bacterium]|nr:polyprenyl synthetase family protein [Syntrophomonadaceae bacterium]
MDFNLELFLSQLQQKKDYVESCLDKILTAQDVFPPLIHQAMRYAVFNGGKRLRPIMVLESGKLAGCEGEALVNLACALEMIHSYSLVHDDLPAMDNDDLRRGKPTCHKVFGEANAILAGDALLTGAFQLLARTSGLPGVNAQRLLQVIDEIAGAAGSEGMIGGQVIDLNVEYQNEEHSLEKLHSLKTGALFTASLRSGAILGGMDANGLTALTDYARHFGLAFQITDDILDVDGDQSLLGKPVGSDEKNLKMTYTTCFGLDGAREMARQEVEGCLQSLNGFGSEADFLRSLAEYLLYRTY